MQVAGPGTSEILAVYDPGPQPQHGANCPVDPKAQR